MREFARKLARALLIEKYQRPLLVIEDKEALNFLTEISGVTEKQLVQFIILESATDPVTGKWRGGNIGNA